MEQVGINVNRCAKRIFQHPPKGIDPQEEMQMTGVHADVVVLQERAAALLEEKFEVNSVVLCFKQWP